MQRIKFDQYETGSAIPELSVGPIHHMDLVRYAGASGDFNPIHTDPEFANKVGLGGTIAHGMYVMAQLGRLCSNWAHPAQIKSFGVKFKGMTRPGQTLTCRGTVKRKKEDGGEKLLTVSVEAVADDGEVKVAGDLVVKAD
ncbi:MAG: MaoC family dehydratase [Spirochaetales bacterium]|nr:MaoC family dehydratase [Leptospiraceae bacterium]MCP5483843.1 MaoC family dehydratase [Spirochaetales bacterium]MCP5486864.1 MaoC family dehydratase [Spirochaetales bacterium]